LISFLACLGRQRLKRPAVSGRVTGIRADRSRRSLTGEADAPVNMLSVVVKHTRTQNSLLAPLAAAASVGAAITSNRNVDHDDDTSERILAEKPPPAVNDRWLRLRIINSTVLPGARFNIQTNKYECCSCESPFLYLSRRETLRWLDKTSSNATLESRYKVRRCHIR
jgi:hypothetical protein